MPFDLSPQQFLYFQIGLLALGVVFLLWRPKSRRGFTLKMGKPIPSTGGKPQIPSVDSDRNGGANSDGARNLQVFFNYNGHSFEAYEVLGLPAGTSLSKIEESVRAQLQVSDKESRPFLEAALHALKSSRN